MSSRTIKRWGIETKAQKSFIRDRIEFDYLSKLKEDHVEWINSFNLAVANGDFKPLADLGVHIPLSVKAELNSERYAAELCSTPNNAQIRKTVQTKKFRKNLIRTMLFDLTGEEYEVAAQEAYAICGIIPKERK